MAQKAIAVSGLPAYPRVSPIRTELLSPIFKSLKLPCPYEIFISKNVEVPSTFPT